MSTLIPALAVTVGPLLLLAPVVYALRPQSGRHTGIRVPDWLNPYDLRVRDAFRHYADKEREPYEESDDVIWNSTAERDLTGAFPVVRAA
ncbi:hypothetical protein [Micromonospora chersina]